MPRVRFGVVLLIPPPFDREIDGLRRACGDRQIERVPPHLTIVPPVNVRTDEIGNALRLLRGGASATAADREAPLDLVIGPPASFRPVNNTSYLAVSGPSLDALHRLRDRVFRPPLERRLDWPFVPHVTIADETEPTRIDATLTALADYCVPISFDRLHLLREQRDETGQRRWIPVADASFRPPAIVGRGGIELELTTTMLLDPEALALVEHELSSDASERDPLPTGASPLVVTARRRGEVVGVAQGWTRDDERGITTMLVAPAARGQGIGRQLALALEGSY